MADKPNFLQAAGAPIILEGVAFPRLTIRTTAKLCAELRSEQGKRLRQLAVEEVMSVEARVKFLSLTIAGDFGLSHLWDWSITADGSRRIVQASLQQGGMAEKEACDLVDSMSGSQVEDTAMEIVDHQNSPTRIASRRLEAEAKATKEKDKQKVQQNPT